MGCASSTPISASEVVAETLGRDSVEICATPRRRKVSTTALPVEASRPIPEAKMNEILELSDPIGPQLTNGHSGPEFSVPALLVPSHATKRKQRATRRKQVQRSATPLGAEITSLTFPYDDDSELMTLHEGTTAVVPVRVVRQTAPPVPMPMPVAVALVPIELEAGCARKTKRSGSDSAHTDSTSGYSGWHREASNASGHGAYSSAPGVSVIAVSNLLTKIHQNTI